MRDSNQETRKFNRNEGVKRARREEEVHRLRMRADAWVGGIKAVHCKKSNSPTPTGSIKCKEIFD
jgi:hypothetical protein